MNRYGVCRPGFLDRSCLHDKGPVIYYWEGVGRLQNGKINIVVGPPNQHRFQLLVHLLLKGGHVLLRPFSIDKTVSSKTFFLPRPFSMAKELSGPSLFVGVKLHLHRCTVL